jgi:hypothetical protein
VRIGDLAAIGDGGAVLLVSEHVPRIYARIYRVVIEPGTTLLDGGRGVAYEAGAAPYTPVEKALVLDLTEALAVLPVPAKVEGIAPLDARTVLLALDNDYGFASDGLEIAELPDVEKRVLFIQATSPFQLR